MPHKIGQRICLAACITDFAIPMNSRSIIKVLRPFLAFPHVLHEVSASLELVAEGTLSLLAIREAFLLVDIPHVTSKIGRQHHFMALRTFLFARLTTSSSTIPLTGLTLHVEINRLRNNKKIFLLV
jgi:hypothetical protein